MSDPTTWPVRDPAAWSRTLDDLGGFFTLTLAPGPEAVPWPQVLDARALGARIEAVRASLAGSTGLPVADVHPQVAASATQVGLASRLWSVALATSVGHGWLPDLSSANLVASPVHRGPVPLGVADSRAGYAVPTLDDAVTRIDGTLVRGSLAELDQACAAVGRTPVRVLVSNSASALVGGARVLARQRPGNAPAVWELTGALLSRTDLAQGGRAVDPATLPDGVGGAMGAGVPGATVADEAFLRSGCCVFYRLPGHGLCPDCVLAPAHPERVTEAH